MTIKTDIQKLEPGALVELFRLDMTGVGGDVRYFHAGTNGLRQPVVFGGKTFEAWPIKAEGFEASNTGAMPRPKLTIGNVEGMVTAELANYQQLLGCPVARIRTFAKYLDAVNFADGNPSADPDQRLPDEIWIIDRKSRENSEVVEFELASPIDAPGKRLPGRMIIQNCCPWVYRSEECGYSGGACADGNDNAVTDLTKDACGKRLVSCELRHGAGNPLPYGGFPAAGLINTTG